MPAMSSTRNAGWNVLQLRAWSARHPLRISLSLFGCRHVNIWWQSVRDKLEHQERLSITEVPFEASQALAQLASRSMRLQVTIQEGHVLVTDGIATVPVELRVIKAGPSVS